MVWVFLVGVLEVNNFSEVISKNAHITYLIIGIEAEAVMLGQSISMLLPEVIGYKVRLTALNASSCGFILNTLFNTVGWQIGSSCYFH